MICISGEVAQGGEVNGLPHLSHGVGVGIAVEWRLDGRWALSF